MVTFRDQQFCIAVACTGCCVATRLFTRVFSIYCVEFTAFYLRDVNRDIVGRDGAVGIAAGLTVRRSNTGWAEIFRTQPPLPWAPGHSRG